jgi:hypothetical protein
MQDVFNNFNKIKKQQCRSSLAPVVRSSIEKIVVFTMNGRRQATAVLLVVAASLGPCRGAAPVETSDVAEIAADANGAELPPGWLILQGGAAAAAPLTLAMYVLCTRHATPRHVTIRHVTFLV